MFDLEDREEFACEIWAAAVAALSRRDRRMTRDVLHRWRVTAQSLEDPVRRAVLYGPLRPEDFVEVTRPEARWPQEG